MTIWCRHCLSLFVLTIQGWIRRPVRPRKRQKGDTEGVCPGCYRTHGYARAHTG